MSKPTSHEAGTAGSSLIDRRPTLKAMLNPKVMNEERVREHRERALSPDHPVIRGMAKNLAAATPKNHFTIGIQDDVTGTRLGFDPSFSIEQNDVFGAVFFGLGSDGTVGANKESIKIIGENTDHYAQAYFVY